MVGVDHATGRYVILLQPRTQDRRHAIMTPVSNSPVCLFDLDQTLVDGRTVLRLGERFGVLGLVEAIWAESGDAEAGAGVAESQRIVRLFTGVNVQEFARVCSELPFRPGAVEAVRGLRAIGYRVGVASATFTFATNAAKQRLGLDFAVGVEVEHDGDALTGRILPGRFNGDCGQFVCKERVLEHYASAFTMAVGDGRNDVCMLQKADLGVAVEPCHEDVRSAADRVVRDLREVPALARGAAQVGFDASPRIDA